MWNPFKKEPPPPSFDPFEVEELIARNNASIAEMGAADDRLNKTIKRAEAATKEAKTERERLEQTILKARALPRKPSRGW